MSSCLIDYWIEPDQALWIKADFAPLKHKTIEIYSDPIIEPITDVLTNKKITIFYRFDNDTKDSCNNYHGVLHNNIEYTNGYASKTCAVFKNNSYIKTSNISISPNITFLFWIKIPNNNNQQGNFITLSNNKDEFAFSYDNNKLQIEINKIRKEFDYILPVNEWVHIILTIKGAIYTLYINGIYHGFVHHDPLTTTSLPNISQLTMGKNLSCLLDNFRLYDCALSHEEINKIHKHEIAYFSDPERVFNFFDDFTTSKLDRTKWEIEDIGLIRVEKSLLKLTPSITQKSFIVKSIEKFSPSSYIGIRANLTNKNTIIIMNTRINVNNEIITLDKRVNEPNNNNYYTIEKANTFLFSHYPNNPNTICLVNNNNKYIIGGYPTDPTEIKFHSESHFEIDYVFAADNKYQNPPYITSVSTTTKSPSINFGHSIFNRKYTITFYNPNNYKLPNYQLRIPLSNLQLTDNRIIVFEN